MYLAQTYLLVIARITELVWTSAKRANGSWWWEGDKTELSVPDWKTGAPTEDQERKCAAMGSLNSRMKMEDVRCNDKYIVICEKEAEGSLKPPKSLYGK